MSLAVEEKRPSLDTLAALDYSDDMEPVEECVTLPEEEYLLPELDPPCASGDVHVDSTSSGIDSMESTACTSSGKSLFVQLPSDVLDSLESAACMGPGKSTFVQLSPGVRSPKSSAEPVLPLVVMDRIEDGAQLQKDAVDVRPCSKKSVAGMRVASVNDFKLLLFTVIDL